MCLQRYYKLLKVMFFRDYFLDECVFLGIEFI